MKQMLEINQDQNNYKTLCLILISNLRIFRNYQYAKNRDTYHMSQKLEYIKHLFVQI